MATCSPPPRPGIEPMYLVDTHQHLWDLEQRPYSWCRSVPALHRSFRIGDYAQASAGLGITKTVFVECDVDDGHEFDEAAALQRLSDQHPSIAGIVASARPEREDFRAQLDALARLPKVRGIRRVLHTQPDEFSRQPRFAENLRLLREYGFTFDLCALARQLPIAEGLVKTCPDVTFVLDHCGIPDIRGGAFDGWAADLQQLARYPNLHCKVSGLVAYAQPHTWSVADLRPWFDHVLRSFGWDRVLWGGDWPVCTLSSTLQRWVEATHELTSGATDNQRARFFHRNAERLYRV